MESKDLIEIDGSAGEGGGQILRSAIAAALITHKPLRITNIRHYRNNPGLRHQHLVAIEAALAISGSRAEGMNIGSTSISFFPNSISCGNYAFDIPTAGSVGLVLQTVYLPLCFCDGVTTIAISGGTHVNWSPTIDYLQLVWSQMMKKMGPDISVELEKAGFYPKGGGKISVSIKPVKALDALTLTERGKLKSIHVTSAVANIPIEAGLRQKEKVEEILSATKEPFYVELKKVEAFGKGSYVFVLAEYENTVAGFSAQGDKGKSAEDVAAEACNDFIQFHKVASAGVDKYMGDQLLLPLMMAKEPSTFTVSHITNHLLTNAQILQKFFDRVILVDGKEGEAGTVEIR